MTDRCPLCGWHMPNAYGEHHPDCLPTRHWPAVAALQAENADLLDTIKACLLAADGPVDLDDLERKCNLAGTKPSHFIRSQIDSLKAENERLKAEVVELTPEPLACNPVRYSADKGDPWWVPKLVDHEFCERLRKDYPQHADLNDESIAEEYEYTLGEYATTWDHTGDAYDQFKELADAYFNLKAELAALKQPVPALDGKYRRCHYCKAEFHCTDNKLPAARCPDCDSADTRAIPLPRLASLAQQEKAE